MSPADAVLVGLVTLIFGGLVTLIAVDPAGKARGGRVRGAVAAGALSAVLVTLSVFGIVTTQPNAHPTHSTEASHE